MKKYLICYNEHVLFSPIFIKKQFRWFHNVLESETIISTGNCRKDTFSSAKDDVYNNHSDSPVGLGTLGEDLWNYSGWEP